MIIILEGMSTSGKTTIQDSLVRILKERKISCKAAKECLPSVPSDQFDSRKSVEAMMDFLQSTCQDNTVIICDRLHLSHIAITNGNGNEMRQLEKELSKYDPLLVFLAIDEDRIEKRIKQAVKHRGYQWAEELAKRGGNIKETVDWFKGTQQKLRGLFQTSTLPKVLFDTTDRNFGKIAFDLAERIDGKFN